MLLLVCRRAWIFWTAPQLFDEQTTLFRYHLVDTLPCDIEVLTQPRLVTDGQRPAGEHVSNDPPQLRTAGGSRFAKGCSLYSVGLRGARSYHGVVGGGR